MISYSNAVATAEWTVTSISQLPRPARSGSTGRLISDPWSDRVIVTNTTTGSAILDTMLFKSAPNSETIESAARESAIREAIREVVSYGELVVDWDGAGGLPPSEQTLLSTVHLLYDISVLAQQRGERLSEVTPGPLADGSMMLELRGTGRGAILTLTPDGKSCEVFLRDAQGLAQTVDLPLGALSMDAIVDWLGGTPNLPTTLAVLKSAA